MNYRCCVFLCLFSFVSHAMKKDVIVPKSQSGEINRSAAAIASLDELKSTSAGNSPQRSSVPSAMPEREPKKSTSSGGSPAGSRLGSKIMGKRESKDLSYLKEELAKFEKTETLSNEQMIERYEKAIKETNPILRKKELEQLACARIKNPVFNAEIKRQAAGTEVFKLNAHDIAMAAQNRLTYLHNKNPQEAFSQEQICKKLFLEQKNLLLRLIESEDSIQDSQPAEWRALEKMVPIFIRLSELLKKDGSAYQALDIKEELFLPQ